MNINHIFILKNLLLDTYYTGMCKAVNKFTIDFLQ